MALYSGGKDSTYALYLAQQAGFEVRTLITVLPQEASMMYQVPNVEWASLSAEALGVPQLQVRSGEGVDQELRAMATALRKTNAEGVVVGAVASDFQFTRVHEVCEDLGLWVYAPLWRKDPHGLVREYVDAGFVILVVAVSAEGLDESWLGRVLDNEAIDSLAALSRTYGVHPAGEGGEFETWVVNGPNFATGISVRSSEKRWEGTAGTFRVLDATLDQ